MSALLKSDRHACLCRPKTDSKSAIGDATNLSRVVTNLVSNAIYDNRPHGKIDVQLKTGRESMRLIVRDTGKGIPEESRDLLFNRFYRADKSRARTSGGHGLGLAITQAIIEAHGGTSTSPPRRRPGRRSVSLCPALKSRMRISTASRFQS